jgi:TIGR03009 family protein
MGKLWIIVAAGLLATAAGYAQQPPTVPGKTPPAAVPTLDPRNPLDALLMRWEEQMAKIQTVEAKCTRTSIDQVFKVVEVFEGKAKYMKPNLAMLEMSQKDKPTAKDKPAPFEKYICTGTFFYVYVPSEKVIRVYEMPPPKPGAPVANDNFLSFLFGIKALDAKIRYDLHLVKGPPDDKWYYYVKIVPRSQEDKQDFQEARLVLTASTYMPRELWFKQPNGNEVKWDIPAIESGVTLNRADFIAPTPPPGWKLERAPKTNPTVQGPAPAPRIVRPNGK